MKRRLDIRIAKGLMACMLVAGCGTVTKTGFTPIVGLPFDQLDQEGNPVTPAAVPLGTASTYAVLAGSTITNTSATTQVNGDVGVSPGSQINGLLPSQVNGTIHAADAAAAQAKLDLTTAFNDAKSRATHTQTLPGNLAGLTFTPGLYSNSTSVLIDGGDVTLDAQGNVNASFIFQMGSTMTTGPGSKVILTGGTKAANVYWQVGSSATLDTGSTFKGNILAQASITAKTNAVIEGRLLTQTGAVTMDANTVTKP